MDSGLEAFLRKRERARDPHFRKPKKFLNAEKLANTIVQKREALEARSGLFNSGPMHISGTGVHYQKASDKSDLPHTNPGLVQMRIHEIKRRGPSDQEKHHLKTHELLASIAKNTVPDPEREDAAIRRVLSEAGKKGAATRLSRAAAKASVKAAVGLGSVGSAAGSAESEEPKKRKSPGENKALIRIRLQRMKDSGDPEQVEKALEEARKHKMKLR